MVVRLAAMIHEIPRGGIPADNQGTGLTMTKMVETSREMVAMSCCLLNVVDENELQWSCYGILLMSLL